MIEPALVDYDDSLARLYLLEHFLGVQASEYQASIIVPTVGYLLDSAVAEADLIPQDLADEVRLNRNILFVHDSVRYLLGSPNIFLLFYELLRLVDDHGSLLCLFRLLELPLLQELWVPSLGANHLGDEGSLDLKLYCGLVLGHIKPLDL